MMRLIRLLIAALFLATGLLVGALNHQPVVIDLGFDTLHATLGVSVLVALLLGAVLGGLAVTASVVLPLQRRLRRARSAAAVGTHAVDAHAVEAHSVEGH